MDACRAFPLVIIDPFLFHRDRDRYSWNIRRRCGRGQMGIGNDETTRIAALNQGLITGHSVFCYGVGAFGQVFKSIRPAHICSQVCFFDLCIAVPQRNMDACRAFPFVIVDPFLFHRDGDCYSGHIRRRCGQIGIGNDEVSVCILIVGRFISF